VNPDCVIVPVEGSKFNGQGAFYKRREKTLPTARRPAALLTLSRQ
jgi:hypothetical protein